MTEQERIRKVLDNHDWKERWNTIKALKFLWEAMPDPVDFGQLIRYVEAAHEMRKKMGEFEAERFKGKDGVNRQYYKTMIEIAGNMED